MLANKNTSLWTNGYKIHASHTKTRDNQFYLIALKEFRFC